MRRSVLLLMFSILLLPGISAFAQADPAKTGGSLEAEVAELKRIVAEHERRIAALEAQLAQRAPAPAVAGSAPAEPMPEETSMEPMAATKPMEPAAPAMAHTRSESAAQPQAQTQSQADLPPWAREESWRKIQIGMSEDEVRALLGEPESSREIGFSSTLIYKGSVPGRGFLKGIVKLKNGKVSDLDLPAF